MAPLQLHVWGPAFALPSLDPQCLAAIAYLSQTVPSSSWELIPSSDPSISPTGELPVLRDDLIWIGGFQAIVGHLRQRSNGQWHLDARCSPGQQADIAAFTSHIFQQAPPLLDLLLYISSANYHATTRAAYSSCLSWPFSWILPSRRRSAARERTAHLGLSSLDLDLDPKPDNFHHHQQDGLHRFIPTGIDSRYSVKHIQPSASLLQMPEHKCRIRLDSLASAFFGPLNSLLLSSHDQPQNDTNNSHLLLDTSKPTTLDCLATAYLSLMLTPEVPYPWLAESLRQNYSNLHAYAVGNSRFFCYHGDLHTTSRSRPTTTPLLVCSSRISQTVLKSTPLLSYLFSPPPLKENATKKDSAETTISAIWPLGTLALLGGMAGVAGYALVKGEMPFRQLFRKRGLKDMGDAGKVLEALRF